ncbi:MAG: site-specific DNA-methyltransferase [Deltaproteobacteria bacterium]|nr:site-specific DNA-methyltransferase [Deltaproteobacteria bacterium]
MDEVENESIALVVTSPPYNVGMEYEDKKSLKEYLYFLSDVWLKLKEKLIIGGRLAINIANTGRNPYIPLASYVTQQLLHIGMVPEGEIIWVKPVSSKKASVSFGSWRSPSNPMLSDRHEYVLIFRKDERRRDIKKIPQEIKEISQIDAINFLQWRESVWNINPNSIKGHPCPFPRELARRLILFYSFASDIILDPFMGSGTTAVEAQSLNRRFVGYDSVRHYVAVANKRLEKIKYLS